MSSYNVQNYGSYVRKEKLLDAVTATGLGMPVYIKNLRSYRFDVWGTGIYTLQIQVIGDSGTPRTIPVWDIANKTFVSGNTISIAGFYEVDVQSFVSILANVLTISGGNVNASGGLMA